MGTELPLCSTSAHQSRGLWWLAPQLHPLRSPTRCFWDSRCHCLLGPLGQALLWPAAATTMALWWPISGLSRCHLQPAFSSLPDRAATSNSSHGLPASWNSTGELSLWSSALTHRHSCRSCLPTGVPTHCDQGAGSRALWVLAAGFPRAPSPGRPSGQSLSATVFHVCGEQGRERRSHTQIPPGTKGCCPQGTQFLVRQSFPPE